MSAENIRNIISSTLSRAAFVAGSLGEVKITKALAGLADISEDKRKILLAVAHQAIAKRLKKSVERNTPRYRLHAVMAANLLGKDFQQTETISPQSQQNTSPDQPQDHF